MKEFNKFFFYFKTFIWRNNKLRFSSFVFFTFVSVQLAAFSSYLIKEIVDKGIINKNLNLVIYLGILVLIFWLISIFLSFLSTIILRFLRNKVEINLKLKIISDFFSASYDFISSYSSGYFLSRIHDEPDSLLTQLLNISSGLIIHLFWVLLGFSIGLFIAPQLALFIIPFVILNIIINYKFGEKFKIFTKERNEKSALFQGYLNSVIENYKLIKIFEITQYIKNKFKEKLKELLNFLTKITFFSAGVNNIQAFNQIVMQIGLLVFAGFEIINNRLSIGSLLGFNVILWQLLSAIDNLYDSIVGIRESVGEIERIEEIRLKKYDFVAKVHENEELVVKNVRVKFNKKIIKYPDFKIRNSEKVLIVGENGTGKTTLLYVIAGLVPFDGEIYYPSKFSISFSFAPPLLLDGTVYENLKIFNNRDEEIDYLLSEFEIINLKEKDVKNLSAGEKKKVDLIRSLLKESKIYLFDEPFSHLDENGKDKFLEIIKNKLKDKTLILTSPVCIQDFCFDKILELKKEGKNENNK